MANEVRIALDGMGGDCGPSVVVPAAAIALVRRPDVSFSLYGDEKLIRPLLAANAALAKKTRLVHCDVSVKMTDKPSQALRAGRRSSSMWQAIDAVKKGEADFAISAGNTGALMAMAKILPSHHAADRSPGDRRDMADAARRIRSCSTSGRASAPTRST